MTWRAALLCFLATRGSHLNMACCECAHEGAAVFFSKQAHLVCERPLQPHACCLPGAAYQPADRAQTYANIQSCGSRIWNSHHCAIKWRDMETRTAPGHSSAPMHSAACAGLSVFSMHLWAASLHPTLIPCTTSISVNVVVITAMADHETIRGLLQGQQSCDRPID